MPLMDGFEVITRLRTSKNPQVANVPIIAVTALAMTGDRERCLKAGANEYISKPVQAKSLMEAIQQVLSDQK
jgi:CheY-like chemotaxis protein